MHTADQLRSMDINQLIKLIETSIGSELSLSSQLQLSMLHGVSRVGHSISVIDVAPGGSVHEEFLDYDRLSELVNQRV